MVVCRVVRAAVAAWDSSRRGVWESLPSSVAAACVDPRPCFAGEGLGGNPERSGCEVSVGGDLKHWEAIVRRCSARVVGPDRRVGVSWKEESDTVGGVHENSASVSLVGRSLG